MTYDRAVILTYTPNIFTVKAAGTISGGNLVMFGSGTNTAGSAYNAYAWNDVAVLKASGTAATAHETVIGMALKNTESGADVAIITEGIVSLPAGSNGVSGGAVVSFIGYADCVERTPTGSLATTAYPIGRALTDAAVANFTWVNLDC